MTKLALSGGRVEVRSWPSSPGAPAAALVFLHEGLGSAGLWKRFPAALRDALGGPATVAWSRHGYGRSDPALLPRQVGYMHHEADVVLPELLDRLGIGRAVLVGHSDGASIALLHAGNLEHRSRVSALVLLAPHVVVEEESIRGIEAARRAYLSGGLRERLARHHDDVDATFWGWNDIWLSPAFRSWDIRDRLPSVRCPVLLLQGTNDPYGTPAQLDAIRTGVAGPVAAHLLEGVGHAPHLEAPDTTLDLVSGWLAERLGLARRACPIGTPPRPHSPAAESAPSSEPAS